MAKLNIGAGTDIRKDFINLDIRNLEGIDLVADIRTCTLPMKFDYIVCQHLLEYIPRASMVPVLTKLKDALSPSGILEIRVTDWSLVSKYLYLNMLSGEQGISHEMALSLLYGRQANSYDIRYSGFTADYLQGVLNTVGFRLLTIVIEDFDIIVTVTT